MKRAALYLVAAGVLVVVLSPFFWALSTSLKTRQQVHSQPLQVVPTTFWWRPASPAPQQGGREVQVVVKEWIAAPAVLVAPTAGTRRGQTIAIARAAWDAEPGAIRLAASAMPVPVELLEERPAGVVEVTFADPADAKRLVTRFVAPGEVVERADPQFGNYRSAWDAFLPVSFTRFVFNTFTVTVIAVVGQTLSCSLVGYGFARFRFRGRRALFLLLLSTMMLPGQVTLIPVFLMWRGAGLVDTFGPLTIPAWFAQSAFSVFLMRQFFLSVPRELDEAAMIDGCGPLRIWWQILLPLSKPAVATVAVLAFVAHWDDFFGPLIYLTSLEKYTVGLALRLFQDQNQTEVHLLMAAALIHMIPVVALFFAAQRYFVKGVAMTGMKG